MELVPGSSASDDQSVVLRAIEEFAHDTAVGCEQASRLSRATSIVIFDGFVGGVKQTPYFYRPGDAAASLSYRVAGLAPVKFGIPGF